ncbi:hypothetical protein ElyMa_005713200 [Elysia marginata]|uniref:Uncharacterized protein n=1 Tax=Elysia marginata TaxID=1093978 RepID=A0AAV4FHH8_9GAST|nr:hypothetical protein ElyMa_005713200 [Elysia marginata]
MPRRERDQRQTQQVSTMDYTSSESSKAEAAPGRASMELGIIIVRRARLDKVLITRTYRRPNYDTNLLLAYSYTQLTPREII